MDELVNVCFTGKLVDFLTNKDAATYGMYVSKEGKAKVMHVRLCNAQELKNKEHITCDVVENNVINVTSLSFDSKSNKNRKRLKKNRTLITSS
jgi:hypothetical protein